MDIIHFIGKIGIPSGGGPHYELQEEPEKDLPGTMSEDSHYLI